MGSKNEYLILPILQILSGGYPLHRNDIIRQLAARLSLSKVECDRISQEGSDVVGHVTHMLKRAGLIERERGVSVITPEGEFFLDLNPKKITKQMVTNLPKYKAYKPVNTAVVLMMSRNLLARFCSSACVTCPSA